jgi:hypothetical protein
MKISLDEDWDLVDRITISTKCGIAKINTKFIWSSENKELQKYLNTKFNRKHPKAAGFDYGFGIVIYILADQASFHLKGEITEIHKRKPQPEDMVEPDQPILI